MHINLCIHTQIIELGNPKNIFLDNTIGNNTVVINFVFRNLVSVYLYTIITFTSDYSMLDIGLVTAHL